MLPFGSNRLTGFRNRKSHLNQTRFSKKEQRNRNSWCGIPICNGCRGIHLNIACPRILNPNVPVCQNCNQGRHVVEYCARPIVISSKIGKQHYHPFVYGDEDMYEADTEHNNSNQKLSDTINTTSKMLKKTFEQNTSYFRERVTTFDVAGNLIAEKSTITEVIVPNNATEMVHVRNYEF